MQFVTPAPWKASLQHPIYGTRDTYEIAADWLKNCATVSDWGGSTGFFRTLLPSSVHYTLVDGTQQVVEQVLADLAAYRESSDGILLRHVLDMTADWRLVLANALIAFRRRLAVVTFTPDEADTRIVKQKSGWPIWGFNPNDLRAAMGHLLVDEIEVKTSHPERVYLLERA